MYFRETRLQLLVYTREYTLGSTLPVDKVILLGQP